MARNAKPIQSLKAQLVRSHVFTAILAALTLLIVFVAANVLFQDINRVAKTSTPRAVAASEIRIGIFEALSSLRGWIAIGDPIYLEERRRVWGDSVLPATRKLAALAGSCQRSEEGCEFDDILADISGLEELLWFVEGVAQSPGNEPALLFYNEHLDPVGLQLSTYAALIEMPKFESEVAPLNNNEEARAELSAKVADFRTFNSLALAHLVNFIHSGLDLNVYNYHLIQQQADAALEAINQIFHVSEMPFLQLLNEEKAKYDRLAHHTILLRSRADWNISNHVLASQVIPLSEKLALRTKQYADKQSTALIENIDKINNEFYLINYGVIILMISVLVITFYYAISRATRFVRPINSLLYASRSLTRGELKEDIPILANNELGALTNSFNQMRSALQTKQSELEFQEEKNRAIVETAADCIITIDSKGLIQSANKAAVYLFGYSLSELLGNNVKMLMPDYIAKQHDQFLENHIRTGENKVIGIGREVEGMTRDGKKIQLYLSVGESIVNEQRYFTGIVRDITEATKAKHALDVNHRYRINEASVLALFNRSQAIDDLLSGLLKIMSRDHGFVTSAYYQIDSSGKILSCIASHSPSKRLQKTINLGEGIVGQCAESREAKVWHPHDASVMSIDVGIEEFTPAAIIATPVVFRDSLYGVLVLASGTADLDYESEFISRICHQLSVALNNLEQVKNLRLLAVQLQEKSKNIQEKNIKLQQADKMKSEFLSTMSHELRTPLNSILGFSELIKEGIVGEVNEDQIQCSTDIYQSAEHLMSIINDILDLSKVEAGKMQLNIDQVDLVSLIDNISRAVVQKANKKRIQFTKSTNEALADTFADATKIKQIVFNLLSNAIKFTPAGGSVSIDAYVKSENGQECIVIAVSDTGIGISESNGAKLFQPFQQLDSDLSRDFEGTGLGLVMVKRLVELMDGTVQLESEVGVGSCFTVVIPIPKNLT